MTAKSIKRSDVLQAIDFRNKPENAEFLQSLRFEEATKFRLVYGGRFYQSKEIAGIAHGIATGTCWSRDDLSGGMRTDQAGGILSNLGLLIDDGPLFELEQLRVDRTHGRPAPYQYIVLLWAISQARSRSPRLVPYMNVRDELADLLAPFAIRQTAPDPAMPWFALRNSSWWELQTPATPSNITDADVQSLNLVAGLSESRYERLVDDESFADAAIDVIGRMIGEEPGYDQLLDDLRLTPLASKSGWVTMELEDKLTNPDHAHDSRALIVTWNPDKGAFRQVDYAEAISRTARGEVVEEDWSTGNTKKEDFSGERVFMLQQGGQGRGIMASGTALGRIYPIPHWDKESHPQGIAFTVDIGWEHVFAIEDGIPVDELEERIPGFSWNPPRSGIAIRDESADQLEELWSNHLADLGLNGPPEVGDAIAAIKSVTDPRRKFGRRFTAEENAAIEKRAVHVAREYLESELGYQTADVGATLSYDVHATKGHEVVKVEVKGTTTGGAAVVLTRNEVNLHRAEHPHNALAVVRNITLDRSGDRPVADDGELKLLMPWEINETGLSPIAYDYRTGI